MNDQADDARDAAMLRAVRAKYLTGSPEGLTAALALIMNFETDQARPVFMKRFWPMGCLVVAEGLAPAADNTAEVLEAVRVLRRLFAEEYGGSADAAALRSFLM